MTTLIPCDKSASDVDQYTIVAVNDEKKKRHEWIIKTIFIQDVRGRLWTIKPSTPSLFWNELLLCVWRIFAVELFDENDNVAWITRIIIPILK